jgi:hypothetical protein
MVRVIAGELVGTNLEGRLTSVDPSQGLTLNANFGIAPSTINYHKDGSKSKI